MQPSQWNHISTKDNPADLATRGVTAQQLLESKLWWNGPDIKKKKNSKKISFETEIEQKITRKVHITTLNDTDFILNK